MAETVAIFDNGNYVDTSGNPADWNESDELAAAIDSLGHRAVQFTGTSAAAWLAAIGGADMVLIPELERTSNSERNALISSVGATLLSYVMGGGHLITHEENDNVKMLNSIFGLSLVHDPFPAGNRHTQTGGAAGTAFAGGPEFLADNTSTNAIGNLPWGARTIYRDRDGLAVVALIQVGAGTIVYMGWDWWNALPAPGTQDGGWLDVLNRAISIASIPPGSRVPSAHPEPSTLALLGVAAVGFVVYRRRRRRA